MAIVPAGSPAWTRAAVHTDYGGHVNKRNFMGIGVVNAMTDLGAEELCRTAADMVALARTAAYGILTFTCNDTSPAAPTIQCAYLMSAAPRLTSYAGDSAPSGFPSAARDGTGAVTFTFASSFTDDYGVSGSWTPLFAGTTVQSVSTSPAYFANWVISGHTVQVVVVDNSGVAVGNKTVTLVVW
jgi:hypothetical protein